MRLAILSAALGLTPSIAAAEQPPPGMVEVDGRFFPDLAPLPPMPYPQDNPPDAKKERLGRVLFFDKRLSRDGAFSCATCHDPGTEFGDAFDRARGRRNKSLPRRTRSLKNVGYNSSFFWDGRATSLESQFFMVLRSHDEMDLAPRELVARLKRMPAYRSRFAEVFGGEGISTRTVSHAVAAFERTLRVGDTILDEYLRGETRSMIKPNLEGLKLFKGKARCIICHHGPTLSDGKFHNIGLGPSRGAEEDLGRQRVDGLPASRGKFRTPMLRNSSHYTPYFHDGSIGPIERLLELYNKGGHYRENLDPDIRPLHLTRMEILQLKSFLYTLGETHYQRAGPPHFLSREEEEIYRDYLGQQPRP